MHVKFLVTFDRESADTSEAARAYVTAYLDEEEFVSRGRWGGGFCDWFLIGGRYSGELSRQSWAREIWAEIERWERERGINLWVWPKAGEAAAQLEAEAQALWDAHAPAEYVGIPIVRDDFCLTGYPDDAMVLTPELYGRLLSAHKGEEESDEHADLDDEPVSPGMAGRKWIVVVDYHT